MRWYFQSPILEQDWDVPHGFGGQKELALAETPNHAKERLLHSSGIPEERRCFIHILLQLTFGYALQPKRIKDIMAA